jgi:hypothetical protein
MNSNPRTPGRGKLRIGFVVIATTSLQLLTLSLLAASWNSLTRETPRPHSYFVTHVHHRRRDDGSAKMHSVPQHVGSLLTIDPGKEMPYLRGRPQQSAVLYPGATETPTIPNYFHR